MARLNEALETQKQETEKYKGKKQHFKDSFIDG